MSVIERLWKLWQNICRKSPIYTCSTRFVCDALSFVCLTLYKSFILSRSFLLFHYRAWNERVKFACLCLGNTFLFTNMAYLKWINVSWVFLCWQRIFYRCNMIWHSVWTLTYWRSYSGTLSKTLSYHLFSTPYLLYRSLLCTLMATSKVDSKQWKHMLNSVQTSDLGWKREVWSCGHQGSAKSWHKTTAVHSITSTKV